MALLTVQKLDKNFVDLKKVYNLPFNFVTSLPKFVNSKATMRYIFILIFIVVATRAHFSQSLQDADSLNYRDHAYALAIPVYHAFLKKEPGNAEAWKKLGDCYRYNMNYDSAIAAYEKAMSIDPDAGMKTVRFYYALMQKAKGNYEKSTKYFQEFLNSGFESYGYNGKVIYSKQQLEDRARLEIEGNKMAMEAMKNKEKLEKRVLLKNLGPTLNSPNSDFAPMYYQDTSVIVFTSSRVGTKDGAKVNGKVMKKYVGTDEPFSDIHEATMKNDLTFTEVSAKQFYSINSKMNDGTTAISPDGKTLYITICNGGNGTIDGCHIYRCTRKDTTSEWGKPELVKELVVGFDKKGRPLGYDTQPCLTADGKTLYFASDRPGSYGELDIYYSTWEGDKWSTPKNAGPVINTIKNDQFPSYDSNEGVLYFASAGHINFGGLDIFKAKGSLDQWSKPENMGYPINSSAEDVCYVVNPKNPRTGFLVSNRSTPDSYGNMPVGKTDIYYFIYTVEPYEVTLTTSVKNTKDNTPIGGVGGTVKTKSGLELGRISTDVSGTSKLDISKFLNDKKVAPGEVIVVQINTIDGFNPPTPSSREITIGQEKKQTLSAEFTMLPIEKPPVIVKQTIALRNIYFDYDKYNLREDAIKTLDEVVEIMKKFPNVTLIVAGHTDANGPEQYNITLGQNRAKAAMQYLISKGIEAKRLTNRTLGESMPIADNEINGKDNPEGRAMNRRVEFIIQGDNYDKERYEIYSSNKGTATEGKIK
ncbi:MAG: OmpA family protein [Bacteroidia bacterium]|nr:OmpA family protein [Bacteroidia bacterium]